MTAQLLLLMLLVAAFVVALAILVHEWRWRGAAARPPLPGADAARRGSEIVAASGLMAWIRRLGGRLVGETGPEDDIPDVHAEDIESVIAGRPRAARPTRIVVAGSRGPALTGLAEATPPSDPRRRLARDTLAVVGLGAAVLGAFMLVPRPPAPEIAVLGATFAPDGATARPVIVSPSPAAMPSPSADPTSSPSPETSPSPALSPSPDPSATPTPTATLRATPTPTPRITPRPTPTRTPAPSATPVVTPAPSPSPTPPPSPSPSPTPEPVLASFSFSQPADPAACPVDVTFTDQSAGPVTAWSWAAPGAVIVDDGANATIEFGANGDYDVTLTVTGAGGDESSDSHTVSVNCAAASPSP